MQDLGSLLTPPKSFIDWLHVGASGHDVCRFWLSNRIVSPLFAKVPPGEPPLPPKGVAPTLRSSTVQLEPPVALPSHEPTFLQRTA